MSSNPAGGGLRMRDVRTGGMMGRSKDVVWDMWEGDDAKSERFTGLVYEQQRKATSGRLVQLEFFE